jgi:hypothetical protein
MDPTTLDAAQAAWDTFPGQVPPRVPPNAFETRFAQLMTQASRPICGLLQWARQDSNLGPTDYESAALTN